MIGVLNPSMVEDAKKKLKQTFESEDAFATWIKDKNPIEVFIKLDEIQQEKQRKEYERIIAENNNNH